MLPILQHMVVAATGYNHRILQRHATHKCVACTLLARYFGEHCVENLGYYKID